MRSRGTRPPPQSWVASHVTFPGGVPMSSSVPCPISGVPAADPDLLGRFVELLVRAAGGTIGPPLLLHLRASDGGIELATTPVDDLYAAVIGSDVADHWHGAGVLVAGRARAMVA